MREPWLIGGDFNSLLNFSDKQGGQPVLSTDLQDFKDCVHYCRVQDMRSNGAFITWNNRQVKDRRVYSKIDRTLVNDLWIQEFPEAKTWFRAWLFLSQKISLRGDLCLNIVICGCSEW